MVSIAAPTAITPSQYAMLTPSRPPLSTLGALPSTSSDGRPKDLAIAPWSSSEMGQPAAASMARRQCLSSASRSFMSFSSESAKPSGSNLASAGRARPKEQYLGSSIQGSALDQS